MKIRLFLLCFFLSIGLSIAQEKEGINTEYRAERENEIDNDIFMLQVTVKF